MGCVLQNASPQRLGQAREKASSLGTYLNSFRCARDAPGSWVHLLKGFSTVQSAVVFLEHHSKERDNR